MTEHRREEIILVSTRTTDRVHRGDGVQEIPGGPATYIGATLDRLRRPWRLLTGAHAVVDAFPGPEGDEYTLPPLPCIRLPACLSAGAVILSPIVQEIDPAAIPPIEGLLVLDLQGFVRLPNVPTNAATGPFDLTALLRRADVVKAGQEEIERLTPESRAALNVPLLLETRGREGAVIRQGAVSTAIAARRVPDALTIGAGDTYLAAFVDALLEGASPERAGERAARFTERVLKERRD